MPAGATNPKQSRKGKRLLAIAALVVVALAGALVAGTVPRLARAQAVKAKAATVANSVPRATVAVARPTTADAERVLPGNALPLLEASLFARATGYVKKRYVDIGSRVKPGQLLAVISSPDIDDQLAQARSNLTQARAQLKLAQANSALAASILERDNRLRDRLRDAVSVEQRDTDAATYKTTLAQVEASRASIQVNEAAVQRFADLQAFEKIIAPFPGVITRRNIDPGDLVSADSTALELFHLMRTDVLRVFVNVPQTFATSLKLDQKAVVYRREDPQQQYAGKVTRTADALDANTRTLLTEVQVPNPNNALRPGMYLQVKFVFDRSFRSVLIPAAALATRTGGPRVGVLDKQHRVHYRTVQLGRDYGAEIEVIAGLKAGDTVVVHPGDDIPDGTAVEAVPMPKK
jgi:RND family efflux transporter MFP subunit